MFSFPEIHPGVAEQIFGAIQIEQFNTGRIQVDDAAVEIEELDAIGALLDQVAPEQFEGRKSHFSDSAERTDDGGQGGNEAVFVEWFTECRHVCRDVVSERVVSIAGDEYEGQAPSGCAHLFA